MYADTGSFDEWLVYARTEWPQGVPRSAVIYPDTSVSEVVVNELADRIYIGLDGDVSVYQGFFMPTAPYFLTFEVLREPVSSQGSQ